MSRSILEITQNREFLDSVEKGWSYGANLNLLTSLPSYSECIEYEEILSSSNSIVFKEIFKQPLGYYLIKCFLVLNGSDDKAVFVSDVKLYKTLTDPSARIHISKKIYLKYCSYNTYYTDNMRGISVFDINDSDNDIINNDDIFSNDDMSHKSHNNNNNNNNMEYDGNYLQLASQSHTIDDNNKPLSNNYKSSHSKKQSMFMHNVLMNVSMKYIIIYLHHYHYLILNNVL